jgi:hypothetical protein
MRSLTELRDHAIALLRTLLLGPDVAASDTWDGDALPDDEMLGHLMLTIPFI